MFRARWLILPGIIVGFFMFMVYNGLVEWGKDSYACYNGRHYYNAVGRQRLISVWRLQLFYQPKTWGCTGDERFDPKKYKMENGVLVPIDSSDLTQ